jgi:hypothetical protein
VDLVDEEHRARAVPAQPLAGAPDHRLDVGLAGRDRRAPRTPIPCSPR